MTPAERLKEITEVFEPAKAEECRVLHCAIGKWKPDSDWVCPHPQEKIDAYQKAERELLALIEERRALERSLSK